MGPHFKFSLYVLTKALNAGGEEGGGGEGEEKRGHDPHDSLWTRWVNSRVFFGQDHGVNGEKGKEKKKRKERGISTSFFSLSTSRRDTT